MENWGLILYNENSFHYNGLVNTAATEFNIFRTMSHEVAHMWLVISLRNVQNQRLDCNLNLK